MTGDGELLEAYQQMILLDAKIDQYCTTVSDEDRQTHQGYHDAEDARYEAIDRLIETPAQSWQGIRAKAAALKMRPIQEDPDVMDALAESLVDDVLQLSPA